MELLTRTYQPVALESSVDRGAKASRSCNAKPRSVDVLRRFDIIRSLYPSMFYACKGSYKETNTSSKDNLFSACNLL